ncbi:MAG: hypothetical protein VXY77_04225 [Pseudomonadota bacterium]|nr:hypothetical protein [Pseudomonadota bacterium]
MPTQESDQVNMTLGTCSDERVCSNGQRVVPEGPDKASVHTPVSKEGTYDAHVLTFLESDQDNCDLSQSTEWLPDAWTDDHVAALISGVPRSLLLTLSQAYARAFMFTRQLSSDRWLTVAQMDEVMAWCSHDYEAFMLHISAYCRINLTEFIAFEDFAIHVGYKGLSATNRALLEQSRHVRIDAVRQGYGKRALVDYFFGAQKLMALKFGMKSLLRATQNRPLNALQFEAACKVYLFKGSDKINTRLDDDGVSRDHAIAYILGLSDSQIDKFFRTYGDASDHYEPQAHEAQSPPKATCMYEDRHVKNETERRFIETRKNQLITLLLERCAYDVKPTHSNDGAPLNTTDVRDVNRAILDHLLVYVKHINDNYPGNYLKTIRSGWWQSFSGIAGHIGREMAYGSERDKLKTQLMDTLCLCIFNVIKTVYITSMTVTNIGEKNSAFIPKGMEGTVDFTTRQSELAHATIEDLDAEISELRGLITMGEEEFGKTDCLEHKEVCARYDRAIRLRRIYVLALSPQLPACLKLQVHQYQENCRMYAKLYWKVARGQLYRYYYGEIFDSLVKDFPDKNSYESLDELTREATSQWISVQSEADCCQYLTSNFKVGLWNYRIGVLIGMIVKQVDKNYFQGKSDTRPTSLSKVNIDTCSNNFIGFINDTKDTYEAQHKYAQQKMIGELEQLIEVLENTNGTVIKCVIGLKALFDSFPATGLSLPYQTQAQTGSSVMSRGTAPTVNVGVASHTIFSQKQLIEPVNSLKL